MLDLVESELEKGVPIDQIVAEVAFLEGTRTIHSRLSREVWMNN